MDLGRLHLNSTEVGVEQEITPTPQGPDVHVVVSLRLIAFTTTWLAPLALYTFLGPVSNSAVVKGLGVLGS